MKEELVDTTCEQASAPDPPVAPAKSKPLTTSSLIFPAASIININHQSRLLRRSGLSISNRLRSIASDGEFVEYIQKELQLPLIANERCGSWYIAPQGKRGSAYFKSTDGHWNCWSFSLRRLNLEVLKIVGEEKGCIIVDSTRRGKHLPDALSKTVPIWCAVFNAILFPEQYRTDPVCQLHVPKEIISDSERSQIESRLPGFIEQAKNLDLNWDSLRDQVRKPMRPRWITRSIIDNWEADIEPVPEKVYPVYLCMASQYKSSAAEEAEEGYVQGAGDDNESWSCGLTPPVFWSHREKLLAASDDDLQDLIESLILNVGNGLPNHDSILILPPKRILINDMTSVTHAPTILSSKLIVCAASVDDNLLDRYGKKLLHLKCSTGKTGSRELRTELEKLPPFMLSLETFENIQVCSTDVKDLPVGIVLAILCLNSDEFGNLSPTPINYGIDKSLVRRRLSWIVSSFSSANPSRATLNAVNSFLMRGPR